MLVTHPCAPQSAARLARSAVLLLILGTAILLAAPLVLANGGTMQVASEPVGPYELTVFTSPNPVLVGTLDVSVLVQHVGAGELVQGVRVTVTAEPTGHPGPARTFEATREQATNKLFLAAKFDLPTEGRWRIGVRVTGPLGEGAVHFEVEASQPTLLERPLLTLLLVVLSSMAIVWWLSRLRRKGAARPDRVRKGPRGPE